ncbi:MAG: hypothetical protein FWH51_06340 [Dehalococcoidia bacterium]|nr:hypothetical protein [Dehalococcoidia bacterium]
MIKIVNDIIADRKQRAIAIIGILCVAIIGLSAWLLTGKSDPIPLDNNVLIISAGDVVVVNVFSDVMDDVYGYQFDINYNREELAYRKCLYSDIDEIDAIFATDREQSLLVGATMIGDAKGYSGQEVLVCRVEFIALSDFESGKITLSGVNVVTGSLQYLENMSGWTTRITIL